MEIEKVAKIEHILNLDYSDPQGRQAIDKTLRRIKPFKKYPMDVQIPLEKLEKLYPDIKYVNQLMTYSWGQKVVRFYDLDGNLIEVRTLV